MALKSGRYVTSEILFVCLLSMIIGVFNGRTGPHRACLDLFKNSQVTLK